MLLSDWVFSQSPKSIGELSTALSTREALRYLAPSESDYLNDGPLRIPDSCGGDHIAQRAFHFIIDPKISDDSMRVLARLVLVNLSRENIATLWSNVEPISLGGLDKWLKTSEALGCLHHTPKADIIKSIGSTLLSRGAIHALCNAGHEDCISTTHENASNLENFVLSAPQYVDGARPPSTPLYLVRHVLAFLNESRNYQNQVDIKTFLESMEGIKQGAINYQTPVLNIAAFSEKCFEATQLMARRWDAQEPLFESIDFWQDTVEEFVTIFGEHPTLLAAAIHLAMQPKVGRGRLPRSTLFASEKPLCARVRYAKSQSKKWDWWRGCMLEIRTANERFLFLLSLWTWAPVSLIRENSELVETCLDELSPSNWNELVDFIQGTLLATRWAGQNAKKVAGVQYKGKSLRFAYLLNVKEPTIYARQIFLSHFVKPSAHIDGVANFRQTHAINAALNEEITWKTALEIVKETFAKGVVAYGIPMDATIPIEVASVVIEAPDSYPSSLWDRAQASMSAKAQKSTRPVAKVALKDSWFPV
jgi:hypothetical protein